jgi:AraC-like DNA-binding protein
MSEAKASLCRALHPSGAWSGRVFLGIGRVLYLGGASDTSPHLHHAIQICVGLDHPFRLRPGSDSQWEHHDGAVIRTNQLHQLDASGCEVVMVYLEPESEDARHVAVGDARRPIQAIPLPSVRAIRAATAAARSRELGPGSAARLYRDILAQLGLRVEPRDALDDRIRQTLRAVRAEPSRRWKIAELATAAQLSPRRFRDLFSGEIGISCRQYLLWTHLFAALTELARGVALTEAALAAGFADAAHLTRTFRRMVGIVPSAIARSVVFIEEPV